MAETVGRFQLLEPLGAGTLGELHRARDLERGRTVALRILAQSIVQDEARLTSLLKDVDRVSALSHPAIPSLYEDGQDGDRIYLASEFVPGERLSDMVHGTPLNPRKALDLAVQIADGLASAHATGVTHGALSTRRILVTLKGAVKILDVGMVAWTAVPAVDHVDDFVGLGEVVFEMLVGRPIRRGWPAETKDDRIPEPVRPILRKLVSSNPQERFDSMAVASASLRDAMLRLTTAPAQPQPVPVPPTAASKKRVILAVLGLLLTAALAWFFTQAR